MAERAAPLVRTFRITGLHGYKNVSIDFNGRVRIVIADNGAGKTTILSALRNFLEGELQRFGRLEFETVECEFWDGLRVSLQKSQLAAVAENSAEAALAEIAQYSSQDPDDLRRILYAGDRSREGSDLYNRVITEIHALSPWSIEDTNARVRSLRVELDKATPDTVRELSEQIRQATKGYELLYLPTYRRVETPQTSKGRMTGRVRGFDAYRTSWARRERGRSRRSSGRIQYGLEDVELRLNEIFEDIQRESNLGYRSISATIIDDLLIAGRLSDREDAAELPTLESLERLFSRIGQQSADKRMSTLSEVYERSIGTPAYDSLRYFLKKLSRVIDRTRELESRIEAFVGRVNHYLKASSDEKEFQYDAANMKVVVRNLWTGGSVAFDDLSSGEKQVISMLAFMYLYDENKIVLIDEPELSLSIDWQRRLLPDLADALNCAQLLAITHSPFTFENELDPYAGPLVIERAREAAR
jgi:predicted ATPase